VAAKEAKARIKINKLLEESGWRFFDQATGKANIVLEPKVKLTKAAVDALGDNFEDASKGFIDFLLLDENGLPSGRARSQVGRQESAGRQGAGAQIRQIAELPLRHPFQRQPALLLGSGAGQPAHHHALPHAGLDQGLPSLPAQSAKTDHRAGRQGLHRPDADAQATPPRRLEQPRRTRRLSSRRTACASCVPTRNAPSRRFRMPSPKATDRFLFEMATGTGKT
jgi:hypothetical protein